jgi:hypothetical protein
MRVPQIRDFQTEFGRTPGSKFIHHKFRVRLFAASGGRFELVCAVHEAMHLCFAEQIV